MAACRSTRTPPMANCNHRYSLTGESAIEEGQCTLCGNLATLQQATSDATCGQVYSTGPSSGNACNLPIGHEGPHKMQTFEPFDKMQPGEVDKVFQALCPKCDGRVWIFVPIDTGPVSDLVSDPDARACKNCDYIFWLRGPNVSEVVP